MDEDTVRLNGIEDPISLVRPAPDPMLFVARDQREGARHFAYMFRGRAQFADERDRARGVVFPDIILNAFDIAPSS